MPPPPRQELYSPRTIWLRVYCTSMVSAAERLKPPSTWSRDAPTATYDDCPMKSFHDRPFTVPHSVEDLALVSTSSLFVARGALGGMPIKRAARA